MEYLFYLVLIIVPAAMVFGVAYYFLNKVNQDQVITHSAELRKERQKHILPMKVEAYQRLILFLERIHPNSIVMRLHNPAKNATLMQHELLEHIRSEFEHNIAQQMFVSPQAWDMVKRAKDDVTQLVHISGKQMDVSSTATDLSAKIFELTAQVDPFPTDITTRFLKEEFQSLFK